MLAVNHMNALAVGWTVSDCELCEEMLAEAWERMTYGGILVRQLRDGIYLMSARDRRANAAC